MFVRNVACDPPPTERLNSETRSFGNSFVVTSTEPPAKSPGLSGVAVLLTTIDSSNDDGNRSSGTIFFSGSGLGSSTPLSSVLLYRSARPRTTANLLSTMDTPVTRTIASPALAPGARLIDSALMPSDTREADFCIASSASSELAFVGAAVTATACSCTTAVPSAKFALTLTPAVIRTPSCCCATLPSRKARTEYTPTGTGRRYRPSRSVCVRSVVPTTTTLVAGSGRPLALSITWPTRYPRVAGADAGAAGTGVCADRRATVTGASAAPAKHSSVRMIGGRIKCNMLISDPAALTGSAPGKQTGSGAKTPPGNARRIGRRVDVLPFVRSRTGHGVVSTCVGAHRDTRAHGPGAHSRHAITPMPSQADGPSHVVGDRSTRKRRHRGARRRSQCHRAQGARVGSASCPDTCDAAGPCSARRPRRTPPARRVRDRASSSVFRCRAARCAVRCSRNPRSALRARATRPHRPSATGSPW